MFKVYAVVVPKEFADSISANPYTLVTTYSGNVYLEETTKDRLSRFVYFLLKDVENKELYPFQNNIVSVGVDEIRKRDGKILVK